jgi:hypothetical protein
MFTIFNAHVTSPTVAGLAVLGIFVYIPCASDNAFWCMVGGYIMLAGHRA